MAPPPPAASVAAEAESLEVPCVGCGETLEVYRGLTEFICPDCATPQSLPPELMPKPPRRKALPLPRGAADVRGARLPCGACGALLSVPVGLPRCACPLCDAELAVDTARLRQYLLSSAAAADAIPVVPLDAPSSVARILNACEAQMEHPNGFSAGHTESGQLDYTIDEGEVHGVNRATVRYKEQQYMYPHGPNIASAEKGQEPPLNHGRHQAQDPRSSYSGGTIHAYQEHMNQVIESPRDSVNSELFRESGCGAVNDTTSTDIVGTTDIHPRTDVNVENRNMHTPMQIMKKSQMVQEKSPEHAQEKSANGAIRVQEKQREPLNDANCREEVHAQMVSEAIAGNNDRRRTRRLIGLSAMGANERHGRIRNEATQQVQRDQSGSVVCMDNQISDVEKEHPGRHKVHSCKKRGLMAALNSGLQLRRSKRLAKDSSAAMDNQPVVDTELRNRKIVVPPPNARMPVAESESDGQEAVSPVQNFSGPPATPPPTTNLDMSNPEHFARNYIPSEVRKALAKLSGEAYLHDSMDSGGQELHAASRKKDRRPRGSTLCLKVWTLPKGARVPVRLNTFGEPIGIEAATLSSFLGILARDGILAPLTYHNWRVVPDKNKVVMYHIVKLKFDFATLDELWIMNSLAKKWRSWKSILKRDHFDTHETEEERLADRNPRVLEEQWKFLVSYWSTEKAQALSARNKACAANVTTFQTSGTKSFARLAEEERGKRPNKDEPNHEDFFILTHTPKDGKRRKNAAAVAIARFREQSQKQAEGLGSDSAAPNFRLGFCQSRPRKRATLKASLREAIEAKRLAEEEAETLRKKMIAMEDCRKKLQKDKSVDSSNMMIPDKQYKHMRNMMLNSHFPEELTGEPLVPPGFPQVQDISDNEIFGDIS